MARARKTSKSPAPRGRRKDDEPPTEVVDEPEVEEPEPSSRARSKSPAPTKAKEKAKPKPRRPLTEWELYGIRFVLLAVAYTQPIVGGFSVMQLGPGAFGDVVGGKSLLATLAPESYDEPLAGIALWKDVRLAFALLFGGMLLSALPPTTLRKTFLKISLFATAAGTYTLVKAAAGDTLAATLREMVSELPDRSGAELAATYLGPAALVASLALGTYVAAQKKRETAMKPLLPTLSEEQLWCLQLPLIWVVHEYPLLKFTGIGGAGGSINAAHGKPYSVGDFGLTAAIITLAPYPPFNTITSASEGYMSAERWSKIRATQVLQGATSASQKGLMMAMRAGASYFGVSSLINAAEKVAGGLKSASDDVLVLPFALLYVGIVMRALPLRFVFDCNDSWARSIGWHALLVGVFLLPDQVNVKFEPEATCSLIGLLILGAYLNPNYMRELFGWVSFVLFSSPFLWFLLSTR